MFLARRRLAQEVAVRTLCWRKSRDKFVARGDVDVVILTGGTKTAPKMLQRKLQMNLLAETGGKNATVVTALADRDQAIKHIIHSTFGPSGQKCWATSLLILEQ